MCIRFSEIIFFLALCFLSGCYSASRKDDIFSAEEIFEIPHSEKIQDLTLVVPLSSCRSCSEFTGMIVKQITEYRKARLIMTGYNDFKELRLTLSRLDFDELEVEADTFGIFEKEIAEDPNSMWMFYQGSDEEAYKVMFTNSNYSLLVSELTTQPLILNYNEMDENPIYNGGVQQFYRDLTESFSVIEEPFPQDLWLHFYVDTAGAITNVFVEPEIDTSLFTKVEKVLISNQNWLSGYNDEQKVISSIKLPLKKDYSE